MDQRSFEFLNDESHSRQLQLDKVQHQMLVDLMAALVVTVYQSQEKTQHDRSRFSIKDSI